MYCYTLKFDCGVLMLEDVVEIRDVVVFVFAEPVGGFYDFA